jgi:hypothetical protein
VDELVEVGGIAHAPTYREKTKFSSVLATCSSSAISSRASGNQPDSGVAGRGDRSPWVYPMDVAGSFGTHRRNGVYCEHHGQ